MPGIPKYPLDLITERMDALGLNQKAACRKCGISLATLSVILNEHHPGRVSLNTAINICEGLGIPLRDWLEAEAEMVVKKLSVVGSKLSVMMQRPRDGG